MRPGTKPVLALCAALGALTLARLPAAWASGGALTHVSGSWMALADDLARGTFYRAMYDPAVGYGGTRFFPLVFALDAALLRAGLGHVAAGYALSLAMALAALAGVAVLVRRLGLGRLEAAACAVLALAAAAPQLALTELRGDVLPVGLEALGLAALAGPDPRRRRTHLAAALFVLAFAAKPTALTGVAAGVAFLALRGERRAALRLALLAGTGAAGVIAFTQVVSGGRFLAVMAACASGGADLGFALTGPLRVFGMLSKDPGGAVLVAAGLAAAWATFPRGRAAWRAEAGAAPLLAAAWLAAAYAGAAFVLGSPGTGINHLLELEVAGVVAIAAALARAGESPGVLPSRRRAVLAAAALAAAVGCAGAIVRLHQDLGSRHLAEVRAAAAALPAGDPIVAEDPLVPLLAGRRPFVVDSFMLRLAAGRDPALAAPLLRALSEGEIAAVVLNAPIDHPYFTGPRPRHFGIPVLDAIRRNYRLAWTAGAYHLYAFAGPGAAAAVPATGR